MNSITYNWIGQGEKRSMDFVFVPGTVSGAYPFGGPRDGRPVSLQDFFIAALPVTQALWTHVVGEGSNPAINQGPDLPLENVPWDDITRDGGFLDRVNQSEIRRAVLTCAPHSGPFRLPSETEWEYAARGGPHWRDGFQFSGSNDINAVGWYFRTHGDHTQPVGLKAPNQLGLFDMTGNVWEWCQDVYTPDMDRVPLDGSPYGGTGGDRVLRGGCFHNGANHCTTVKRYEIAHDYHDSCIGFRLAFSALIP